MATGSEAAFTAFDQGGRDLARLLRGVAIIKAMMAVKSANVKLMEVEVFGMSERKMREVTVLEDE